jgi:protein PET100, fungi type
VSSVQFGLYLAFPIGYMWYFGTNLEQRFAVPDFWPTQAQSHKIPFEKEEIKAELLRMQQEMRARKEEREAEGRMASEGRKRLRDAAKAFRDGVGEKGNEIVESR